MKIKKRSAANKGKHHFKNHIDNTITKETRQESYVVRPKRTVQILAVLGEREMTAREIAYEMGYSDLNAVKPRLTELKEIGIVEVVGKKKDLVTDRNVAVWRKVNV